MVLDFIDWIVRIVNAAHTPRFQIGDRVRFKPSERTVGWMQEMEGMYPGYIGKVTRLERNWLNEWVVYVDNKTVGFDEIEFEPLSQEDRVS